MPRLLLALSVFAVAGWTCGDPSPPAGGAPALAGPADPVRLLGTWRLDTETREWLPRACVRLAFPEAPAPSFDVYKEEDDFVVQFHTRDRLAWRARVRRSPFRAQQIVPTTETGRFCGGETAVRLTLRAVSSDVLQGVWQTPACDVCPDRPFGATRAYPGGPREEPPSRAAPRAPGG